MKTELLAIEALNVTFHSKTGPETVSQKVDLVIPKAKWLGSSAVW